MNIDKIFKKWCNNYKEELIDSLRSFENNNLNELIEFLKDATNTWNYSGILDEIIDSYIDINYYSLRKWSVDNYEYIENAMNEFGMPEKFEWHKIIQMGQYLYYSEKIYEAIDDMIEHIKDNYKV